MLSSKETFCRAIFDLGGIKMSVLKKLSNSAFVSVVAKRISRIVYHSKRFFLFQLPSIADIHVEGVRGTVCIGDVCPEVFGLEVIQNNEAMKTRRLILLIQSVWNLVEVAVVL